jgi:hypothetical protein
LADEGKDDRTAFDAARGLVEDSDVKEDAAVLATVLTASPSLRAKLFANPTTAIGKELPPRKYWDSGIDPRWFGKKAYQRFLARRSYRAQLAKAVLENLADRVEHKELAATVNTEAVYEEFFEPVVRAAQKSFVWVLRLSVAAFFVGVGLIAAGVYVAVHPPPKIDATIVGSIFGGSGAISALGAVFAMVVRGISTATTNHAKLRPVLTGFATELGQLRAYAEPSHDGTRERAKADGQADAEDGKTTAANNFCSVQEVNLAIDAAMKAAVELMPSETPEQSQDPEP